MTKLLAFCVLSFALMIQFGSTSSAHGHSVRTVALGGDPWPPYFLGEIGENAREGLGLDILDAIASQLGNIRFEVPLLPWNRALQAARMGDIDGIAFLLRTPEREAYLAYSDPVFSSRNLVWYSTERFPNGFRWQSLNDLKPFRIGINRGYSYGRAIDEAIASNQLNIIKMRSVEALFTLASKQRVDLVLANDVVGSNIVQKYKHDTIRFAEQPTGEDVFHLAITKAAPARDLLPSVNMAISLAKQKGLIKKVLGAQ